jgi:hypothetical protein
MSTSRNTRRRSPETNQVEAIQRLVQAAAEAQNEAAAAAQAAKDALEALGKALRAASMTECRAGNYLGALVKSPGRATNTVDPAGFRKLVKDDKEFFESITVSMTAARKVLPAKTLDTITAHTPAVPGPEVVKVTEVK